jgi:Acyltransferase
VLLVGNHSGGTLIADTFVFAQAFYDHFGPERRFYQLAHDLVFKMPGLRVLVQRYGTVPASPANMGRALRRDAALLVYPGGDHETYRPTWESDQVEFGGEWALSSWRWSTTCPSCRSWPSAVRRPHCSLGAARGPLAGSAWIG